MVTGECSGSKEEPWAKLVSREVDREFEIEIESGEEVICSPVLNSSLDTLVWCAITRDGDGSFMIKNMSPMPILVDGNLVQEELVALKNGSEIIPGPNRNGYMRYVFQDVHTLNKIGKSLKISLDVEHAKCSICLNIWHDVVSISPCLHNFCNACFSEWMRKSSTKSGRRNQSICCPQCRAVVHSVGRNHFLRNIEEAILQTFSSLKRSDEELALADAQASIKSNILMGIPKVPPRKRTLAVANEDNGRVDFPCPQCGTEFEGFKCSQTTSHLQCHECSGMMPARPDIGVPQYCLGCNRSFCAAYWLSQGMDWNEYSIICNPETFKPISDRTITSVPDSVHQNNRYEKDITERCISEAGKTLQDVISEWIAKFINKEIGFPCDLDILPTYKRSRPNGRSIRGGSMEARVWAKTKFRARLLPKIIRRGACPDLSNLHLNHADAITAKTLLCNGCYEKFVDYLLYWFRVTLPPHMFPPDASGRETCWYGYGCRTQHHNSQHARKRNHVCRQTKGSSNP